MSGGAVKEAQQRLSRNWATNAGAGASNAGPQLGDEAAQHTAGRRAGQLAQAAPQRDHTSAACGPHLDAGVALKAQGLQPAAGEAARCGEGGVCLRWLGQGLPAQQAGWLAGNQCGCPACIRSRGNVPPQPLTAPATTHPLALAALHPTSACLPIACISSSVSSISTPMGSSAAQGSKN